MTSRTPGTLSVLYALLFFASLWRMENKVVTFARHALVAFTEKVGERKGNGHLSQRLALVIGEVGRYDVVELYLDLLVGLIRQLVRPPPERARHHPLQRHIVPTAPRECEGADHRQTGIVGSLLDLLDHPLYLGCEANHLRLAQRLAER